MSLYQFINSRILMGRLDPIAVARANRAVRTLDTDTRLSLCRPAQSDGDRQGVLAAREIPFREAGALVNMLHRHHGSPVGHLFSGGVFVSDKLCAAVVAGRPVARHQDDGQTIELTRVVSSGQRNACSKAMGWAIREAKKRGYARVISYTLGDEPGGSLKAVGFVESGQSRGGGWSRPSRRREPDRHPVTAKRRWEIEFTSVRAVVGLKQGKRKEGLR